MNQLSLLRTWGWYGMGISRCDTFFSSLLLILALSQEMLIVRNVVHYAV